MSRVLRKISALNSMRNDWMMFAGRMMKSSRSVRQARPWSVMSFFLCQKNADGQQKHHLRLQVQHGGKFGHGIPFHLDILCLAEPIIIA